MIKNKKEIILKDIKEKGIIKTFKDNLKNRRILSYEPNKKILHIDIVSFCNLNCYNCNRAIEEAPSNEFMSLNQIKKFVKESLKEKKQWEKIVLVGGEPTLHPYFFEVLKEIKKYKDWNPGCRIRLDTNGYGKKVNEILKQIPSWIEIRNSKKTSNKQPHQSYNLAPIDFKKHKKANFSNGCIVTEKCGVGLTPRGFYPCGPGGTVDRVFGFNLGIKNLNKVTKKRLRKQMKTLCKYCGHFKGPDLPKKEKISTSWKKAYNDYKKNKPKHSLY